jgi:hypothetical protein
LASALVAEVESGPQLVKVGELRASLKEATDWECQVQACRDKTVHALRRCTKFLELPLEEKGDQLEVLGVSRLCLALCGEEMHKKYQWMKPTLREQLCQKLKKCSHGHNMLIHVNAENERDLRMLKVTKQAEPLDRSTKSLAYDDTRLPAVGVVHAQVVDELDTVEASALLRTQVEDFSDMRMVEKDHRLDREFELLDENLDWDEGPPCGNCSSCDTSGCVFNPTDNVGDNNSCGVCQSTGNDCDRCGSR